MSPGGMQSASPVLDTTGAQTTEPRAPGGVAEESDADGVGAESRESFKPEVELELPAPLPAEVPAPGAEPAPEDMDVSEEDSTASGPITLFLAGDSIVQSYADTASERDQAGWGQMLGLYVDDQVTIENRAIGGRTARRFIDEGRLDDILADIAPDQFLLVQFGTNDGNRTATYTLGERAIPYFLDPATDFKAYLQRYAEAARSVGAIPIFVTPTPRNSAYCTGGNGTGAHAAAMRELGQSLAVPVIDLNAAAVAYLRGICPAPNPEDFFLSRPDGTVDGTHFQENGARILAGFVAEGLRSTGLKALAAHLNER